MSPVMELGANTGEDQALVETSATQLSMLAFTIFNFNLTECIAYCYGNYATCFQSPKPENTKQA